ncbi:MAG: hypothetical protein EBU90_18865 [Proteobacteria bacterium]|nr:hypothetical protein [Pseudomonadota bacterium]
MSGQGRAIRASVAKAKEAKDNTPTKRKDHGVSAVKSGPGGAGPYRNWHQKHPLFSVVIRDRMEDSW